MLRKLYRFGLSLNYRWAMANAYLTQDRAPVASQQWVQDAEHWLTELWKFDRGMI